MKESGNMLFGAVLTYNPVSEAIVLAKDAERLGFDYAWLGDHLKHNFFDESLEPWTLFGALARETSTIRLGIAVTDPHRRNPALLAQTAMTIDHLSGGRLDVGIGPGEAMNLEPYGIKWDHPVGKMEEAIKLLRMLWTGQPIDFDGRFYQMKEATVAPPPVQQPGPPIWVGSNRPRTLRITGELADGWIPIMTPPDGYRSDLDAVQKAASDAGRNPDDVMPGVWLIGAVGEDGDKLREQAARGGKMFALHAPRHIGKNTDLQEGFDLTEFVPTDESKDALRQAMDDIPYEAVEDCLLCGDADECIETINAFHRAGARLMVLSASGAGGNRRAGIEFLGKKVLPYFRDGEK